MRRPQLYPGLHWPHQPARPGCRTPRYRKFQGRSTRSAACILGCGCLLSLLWKPEEKPLLAQFLGVAFIVFTLITLVFLASNLTAILIATIVLMGLFVVAYPRPRSLVRFSQEGGLSIPLVVLSLVAAVLLAPIAWHDLTYQLRFPVAVYAESGEWMYSFMLAVLLVLGGLLSATKRAACSTGSAGPRPRPSRPASCRGTGSRAAIGRRRRASTRPGRSPRLRARRARRRRGAGIRAPAARRSATRSGRRSASTRPRPCDLARSPRRSTAGGRGGARGGTPARADGPRSPPGCPRPPVRARAGPRARRSWC